METVTLTKQGSKHPETIRIRPWRSEDLQEISDLLDTVGFASGEHILRFWFMNMNLVSKVAINEKNEIIGSIVAQRLPLPENVLFRIHNIIRQDYQGVGLSKPFFKIYEDYSTMGNATGDALIKLPGRFQSFDWKVLKYYASKKTLETFAAAAGVRATDGTSVQLRLADNADTLEKVLDYDRSIVDMDRREYMRKWCSPSGPGEPYARTIAAFIASKIAGFGTIREYGKRVGIEPVYADNQDIAKAILNRLGVMYAEDCKKEEKPLMFIFSGGNVMMVKFVHEMHFESRPCMIRAYARASNGQMAAEEFEKKKVSREKIYATMQHWPA